MLRHIFIALLVLVAAPARGDEALTVRVELGTGTEPWQARYALSRPVRALVFVRGQGDYRRDTWTLPEAFRLQRLGATDRIERVDGSPFDGFAAAVQPYHGRLPADYTPVLRFSDGAMAAFTGQFLVGEALHDDADRFGHGAGSDNTAYAERTDLRISLGDGKVAFDGAVPTGRYVYLGERTTVETAVALTTIDAAAPAWLREHLNASIGAVFELFARRLGPLPAGKPELLATFETLPGGSISFTGGVVGSQLVIAMGLGASVKDSPAERLFLARFFAHEVAHLWNNARVGYSDGADAWIHEGSAEAMAWLGLHRLGLAPLGEVTKLFAAAAEGCRAALAAGPLREAGLRNAHRAFYDCGAVVALATHGAYRRAGAGDLLTFWRQFIEAAEARDGRYDADDYLRLIATVDEALVNDIDALVTDGAGAPLAALARLLQHGAMGRVDDAGALVLAEPPALKAR